MLLQYMFIYYTAFISKQVYDDKHLGQRESVLTVLLLDGWLGRQRRLSVVNGYLRLVRWIRRVNRWRWHVRQRRGRRCNWMMIPMVVAVAAGVVPIASLDNAWRWHVPDRAAPEADRAHRTAAGHCAARHRDCWKQLPQLVHII